MFFSYSISFAHKVITENTTKFVISEINIDGNNRTKDIYVLLELPFKKYDTISENDLKKSIKQSYINLRNTSLFLNSRTDVSWRYLNNNEIAIDITVQERWNIWPEPILENAERNFNTWWKDKDFGKLNYGINLIIDNVRGSNERFNTILRLGYDHKFEFKWLDPLYKREGAKGYGFGAGYEANHEVPYRIEENSLKFLRADEYLMTQKYLFITGVHRPSIHLFQRLTITLSQYQINDTLFFLNDNFSFTNKNAFFLPSLNYFIKLDHRDHRAYPLKGYYLDLSACYFGIPFKSEKTSFGFLKTTARKFFNIKPFYYGIGATAKYSSHIDQPFLFERGLGYGRDFVRGYEYYIINGSHYFLIKQNLKFPLVPSRDIYLSFMPHEKFRPAWFAIYLNLFADAGYVSGRSVKGNDMVNRWLGGAGIGLDIVTYYDKVIRIEATINDFERKGIYIHFIAPI